MSRLIDVLRKGSALRRFALLTCLAVIAVGTTGCEELYSSSTSDSKSVVDVSKTGGGHLEVTSNHAPGAVWTTATDGAIHAQFPNNAILSVDVVGGTLVSWDSAVCSGNVTPCTFVVSGDTSVTARLN